MALASLASEWLVAVANGFTVVGLGFMLVANPDLSVRDVAIVAAGVVLGLVAFIGLVSHLTSEKGARALDARTPQ